MTYPAVPFRYYSLVYLFFWNSLKGFNWLNFAVDVATLKAMACRGWEATLPALQAIGANPQPTLLQESNPY